MIAFTLDGIVYISEFEIAPQIEELTGKIVGKLHVHGWCYHPNHSTEEVLTALKKTFTAHKAVHLGKPHYDKELFENIHNGTEYAYDTKFKSKNRTFGSATPSVLLNLLISIESIRPRGRMGLRFEVNARKAIKTFNDSMIGFWITVLKVYFNSNLSKLTPTRREMVQSTVGADPPIQKYFQTKPKRIVQKVQNETTQPNIDQKTDRAFSAGLPLIQQKLKDLSKTNKVAAAFHS